MPMPESLQYLPSRGAIICLAATVLAVAVIGALYWAQAILIPVALALFLTFILSPIVTGLQRLHVPRSVAVLVTVALAATLLMGIVWIVGKQVGKLAEE